MADVTRADLAAELGVSERTLRGCLAGAISLGQRSA